MASFSVKYLGWVKKSDEPVVLFRMSIERDGQQIQVASVPVDEPVLIDAELNPPDDQLGTALVLEVAPDIEQAVVDGSIPMSDPSTEYLVTAVPEARVRELIAADATAVVHAGGLVFSFEQVSPADGASATG